MASQQAIARAAGGLESVARALREGRRPWDAECREQVAQAIEEFRVLVRRVREWDDGDTVRAGRLALTLESLAGRTSPQHPERRGEAGEVNSGVRAFVGREGALIASALDRAARSLQVAPTEREPLYTVIRRMQSLRGLAELGELTPLPEILDGIELAIGDLTRLFAPPPGVHEVMAAGALALTRLSRDIAEHGKPDPEASEAREFTDLLLRAFAVERDVVPIESLYRDGDTAPSTPPPGQPQFEAPAPLGPLELVSHGEHLCQIADLIARSTTPTERDLRLYHLHRRAAHRERARPGSRRRGARGLRPLDPRGAGVRRLGPVGRRAGGEPQGRRRAAALGGRRRRPDAGLAAHPRRRPPARPGAHGRGGSLSRRRPRTSPTSCRSRVSRPDPEPIPAGADALEISFRTLERLQRERSPAPASLDALAGRAEPAPVVEAVAIASLCYRGRSALERAAAVRQSLTAELAGVPDLAAIRPLLQELLDLVPLALDES